MSKCLWAINLFNKSRTALIEIGHAADEKRFVNSWQVQVRKEARVGLFPGDTKNSPPKLAGSFDFNTNYLSDGGDADAGVRRACSSFTVRTPLDT